MTMARDFLLPLHRRHRPHRIVKKAANPKSLFPRQSHRGQNILHRVAATPKPECYTPSEIRPRRCLDSLFRISLHASSGSVTTPPPPAAPLLSSVCPPVRPAADAMGVIFISVLFASVVYFCIRPPPWLLAQPLILSFLGRGKPHIGPPPTTPGSGSGSQGDGGQGGKGGDDKAALDRAAMPPPPPPPAAVSSTGRANAAKSQAGGAEEDEGEQTTPKVTVTQRADPVPTFSLSGANDDGGLPAAAATHSAPTPYAPQRRSEFAGLPRVAPSISSSSSFSSPTSPSSRPGLMAPPPRPSATSSSLSAQPQRGRPALAPPRLPPARTDGPPLPLPNRGPPGGLSPPYSSSSSSLAPPPTHSSKPPKPSRKVMLAPGCSPLDWARLSGGASADLRNLPPATPYLRVTPSMLRRQNGRKGRDAWTALGGRVYNIQPYVPFHPGGGPELLRGAGKDGTRLFGEIHPWVNYETMLAACLVGVLVEEDDSGVSQMDEMD